MGENLVNNWGKEVVLEEPSAKIPSRQTKLKARVHFWNFNWRNVHLEACSDFLRVCLEGLSTHSELLGRGLKHLDGPNRPYALDNQSMGCLARSKTSRDLGIHSDHCLDVCLGILDHGHGSHADNFDWDGEDDRPPNRQELLCALSCYDHVPWEVSDACIPRLSKKELQMKTRNEE